MEKDQTVRVSLPLSPRQAKVATRLHAQGFGPVWWKVGEGKTRIALAIFAMIAKRIKRKSYFIAVTRRQAFSTWANELEEVGMLDSGWRFSEIDSWDDIEASMRNLSPLQKILWLVSHGMLAKLQEDLRSVFNVVRAITYDEGFLFKNPRTERCKAANYISSRIEQAYLLSGSIMTARNPTDVFGQFYALDQHEILAPTLTKFNSKFMRRFELNGVQTFFAPASSLRRVSAIVKPYASVYFPESTREIKHIVRACDPTKEQLRYMDSLRNDYYVKVKTGQELEIRNAPTIIIKCQQISSGFLKVGRVEEYHEIVDFPSAKTEMLFALLDELMDQDHSRVIVWCAFKHEVGQLYTRFIYHYHGKIDACIMHGGFPLDEGRWKNPKCRVTFATVASGSSVNHFAQCEYAIYYSMDMKWLNFQQSQGRTDRKSSKHKTCYYYYLYTKDSLDRFVHSIVKGSAKKEKQLINLTRQYVSKWLKKK